MLYFTNDDILFFDEDSGNATFPSYEMVILSVDLYNINFGDVKFDEDDPEIIIHVRLKTWHSIELNNVKDLKRI